LNGISTCLPEFLEAAGSKGDLQMVLGADTMLDIISNGAAEVSLVLAREPFQGAERLIITERCDPARGNIY
jgi:hypothetical protein